MKTLMLSTALVSASAFGAMAQDAGGTVPANGSATAVPAFLSSDFTGMSLYTLDSEDARALRAGADMTAAEADRLRWTSSETFVADRDAWNDIGSINDIVMTQDGELRGVLVDVGGFLGIGARTVMVDFDAIYFVADDTAPVTADGQAAAPQPEEINDFSVVIGMSQEELEALPEWDQAQMSAGFDQRDYSMTSTPAATQTAMQEAPADGSTPMATSGGNMAVFSDGYEILAPEERTADRLIGADVFDANGENIGSVNDVVLGNGNSVDGIIVDVGGFLGIDVHTVNLPIDDAQIGWNADGDDVRVQVSMTGDTLEAMPEFEG